MQSLLTLVSQLRVLRRASATPEQDEYQVEDGKNNRMRTDHTAVFGMFREDLTCVVERKPE